MNHLIKSFCLTLACACATFSQSSAAPSTVEPPGSTATKTAVENPNYVSKKSPVELAKFSAPPIIDGMLNDEVWKNASVFGDFLQVQPGDNIPPTHPTEF